MTKQEPQRLTLRNGPATDEFDGALELLESHGYIRPDRLDRKGGKRPYEVHPAILEQTHGLGEGEAAA